MGDTTKNTKLSPSASAMNLARKVRRIGSTKNDQERAALETSFLDKLVSKTPLGALISK